MIQDELGDTDGIKAEVEEYKQKINKLKTVKDTKEKLMKEVDRFSKMPPSSAESSVIRNYLDTVLSLPWNKLSKESFDIKNAEKILNEDHYGLEKVKERVLEYLAVRQNTKGKTVRYFALRDLREWVKRRLQSQSHVRSAENMSEYLSAVFTTNQI